MTVCWGLDACTSEERAGLSRGLLRCTRTVSIDIVWCLFTIRGVFQYSASNAMLSIERSMRSILRNTISAASTSKHNYEASGFRCRARLANDCWLCPNNPENRGSCLLRQSRYRSAFFCSRLCLQNGCFILRRLRHQKATKLHYHDEPKM